MDATERIKSLLEQRGWTAYRLSKNVVYLKTLLQLY